MNFKVFASVAAVTLFLSGSNLAQGATKKSAVLTVPTDSLKWVPSVDMPGVYEATIEGESSKGPHHLFVKFDKGFSAPLHHHTADHFITVVSGTLVLTIDGRENKLPPGSFVAFHDKKPHMTKCEKEMDCVLSLDVRGKWDVVPEVEKKK